jgi:chromosome partitioning protein
MLFRHSTSPHGNPAFSRVRGNEQFSNSDSAVPSVATDQSNEANSTPSSQMMYNPDFGAERADGRDQGLGDGRELDRGATVRRHQQKNAGKKSRRAHCIAFANHKGGTGKTTSCLSIAGYLAKSGSQVLVVDFDPQANATSGLGIDRATVRHSMYDAVLDQCDGQTGVPITQIILETDVKNLHVAPSEFDLAVAECYMLNSRNRTGILDCALEKIRPFYDFILIDLPPTSGLLTINGLCAADYAVVPVDPSIFSLETLEDLKKSFTDIRRITGHSIRPIAAVLIRHVKSNGRKPNASTEVEASLREMFHPVFVVPAAEEIYQTQKEGVPISHYAPRSGVGRAYEKIAQSIRRNAKTTTAKKL